MILTSDVLVDPQFPKHAVGLLTGVLTGVGVEVVMLQLSRHTVSVMEGVAFDVALMIVGELEPVFPAGLLTFAYIPTLGVVADVAMAVLA